jgi:hypothetical protein
LHKEAKMSHSHHDYDYSSFDSSSHHTHHDTSHSTPSYEPEVNHPHHHNQPDPQHHHDGNHDHHHGNHHRHHHNQQSDYLAVPLIYSTGYTGTTFSSSSTPTAYTLSSGQKSAPLPPKEKVKPIAQIQPGKENGDDKDDSCLSRCWPFGMGKK